MANRLMHAWNAFLNRPQEDGLTTMERVPTSYGSRPDRVRLNVSNERSIIAAIYTRLSIDASQVDFRHVRLDDQGRYLDDMDSGLQECLTVEANLDQASQTFFQDLVLGLCDKGVVAVVPVDTTTNPNDTGAYDIKTMRVGEIVQWMPFMVKVSLYNEKTGRREEIFVQKRNVAIVYNPFYSVMNEPNSTLQRLIRKLNLLDYVDEQSSSGKLDLIIQLPYVVKNETRRAQANQRREEIEFQLKGSKYGIAYTDGTEKITQLNRPAENNLLKQIEMLLELLYGQLGITPEVMNGTADQPTTLNYYGRTIDPIVNAIRQEFHRKFLTKTARSQKQAIMYFKDPFKIIPLTDLAEIADKLTRNEITSSNEIRGFVGLKPSKDPKADQLRNSNMPQSELGQAQPSAPAQTEAPSQDISVEKPDSVGVGINST